MARPNIKKQIELPAPGASLYGVECYLKLVASLDGDAWGYSATGDADVAGRRRAVVSATGLATFTAVRPNSGTDGISTPAGTVYELTTKFPDGVTVTEYISVPNQAGDLWVQDILTTLPSDLPSGAGGDMTGAEILTALLPVDGAGSLLDADLLDGQQGAAYVLASGLTESVQDVVGAMATAGANVSLAYDDAGGTLTVAVTGLTETVQDIVGAFTSATGGVTATYDDTANTLVITIADGAIANAKLTTNPLLRSNHTGDVVLPTSAPSAPAAVALHSEKRARDYAWVTGPTGNALPIGDAIWARTWALITPNAGTSARTQGTTSTAVSTVGTVSHPTPGTTANGIYTNVVSAASVNVQSSLRTTGPSLFRGASSDLYAGFEARSRVRYPDASYDNTGASTGTRLWGLALFGTGPTTLFGADRGGSQDLVGFCRAHVNGGATDTNWQIVTCDATTATTTDTGMPFTVGAVYQFALWCPAGATSIDWRIQNVTAGTTASGAATATLPRTTSALDSVVGLLTVDAVARNFNLHRLFLSTDKG